MLRVYSVNVTTSGSAGSATGSGVSAVILGKVLGIWVDYTGMPATTDVTIKSTGGAPPSYNILVLTNTNTDAFHLPRKQCSDNAGAAIAGEYDGVPILDTITVDVAQADAGTDAVKVHIMVQEL